uniref:Uncharacterized protein n=1 Tax=Kwoniella bestiolae CBS 10118 TaxID=1296100 RepID=A0A1B9FUF6_9TREE|nr:hypothetical protein I302_08049 [Kwoniella bestiolae CBS 10118]OCF22401.1 hypothetical protein I302_08049 [Kwoniella bestiolae CBS 10118]
MSNQHSLPNHNAGIPDQGGYEIVDSNTLPAQQAYDSARWLADTFKTINAASSAVPSYFDVAYHTGQSQEGAANVSQLIDPLVQSDLSCQVIGMYHRQSPLGTTGNHAHAGLLAHSYLPTETVNQAPVSWQGYTVQHPNQYFPEWVGPLPSQGGSTHYQPQRVNFDAAPTYGHTMPFSALYSSAVPHTHQIPSAPTGSNGQIGTPVTGTSEPAMYRGVTKRTLEKFTKDKLSQRIPKPPLICTDAGNRKFSVSLISEPDSETFSEEPNAKGNCSEYFIRSTNGGMIYKDITLGKWRLDLTLSLDDQVAHSLFGTALVQGDQLHYSDLSFADKTPSENLSGFLFDRWTMANPPKNLSNGVVEFVNQPKKNVFSSDSISCTCKLYGIADGQGGRTKTKYQTFVFAESVLMLNVTESI